MEEKIVIVLNEMSEYLSITQMKKLQEVIIKTFADNEANKVKISNEEFLKMFLDAKRIEGCSERTIIYYQATVKHLLSQITTEVRKITTEEIREYLSNYQKRNDCSNVTIDNVRRNISSFFSWLEEEDYILKSPMKRIHKIKTKTVVKSVISDEGIEKLRDNCNEKRDLAIIDLLYSTGIRVGELVNLNIDDIDLEEQIHIVNELNRIIKIKEKRQEELKLLDNLIKARFVEMFGDVIHNDRKWECRKFSDITASRLGKMLDTKHQTGTCQYSYLANFNVQWFGFELKNLNKMDFNEKDREEFCLEDGDLLVCEGGEIGRCAVWHNQVENCFFQKALHRVRCNQEIILPDYLAWWFKYNCDHGGFVAIEGAKATISHLTGAKMKMLNVTVPPIGLQKQFTSFVNQVDKSKVVITNIRIFVRTTVERIEVKK